MDMPNQSWWGRRSIQKRIREERQEDIEASHRRELKREAAHQRAMDVWRARREEREIQIEERKTEIEERKTEVKAMKVELALIQGASPSVPLRLSCS